MVVWHKLKQWLEQRLAAPRGQSKAPTQRAKWLAATETSFGVPALDLISVTGGMISTSQNIDAATMAMSWGRKTVADLPREFHAAESLDCELRYPTDDDLPDGFLYLPQAMEQKYVIAYREGQILVARSWTGHLVAVADARRAGSELVVERLRLADESLKAFGDAVATFDWLMRSHALGQVLPLPVDESGAKLLEAVPLSVFGPFGNVARYAAVAWAPPVPERRLRATSALVTAVRLDRPAEVARLAAAGHSLNARTPVGGYTALHVAAIKRDLKLTQVLLENGADPNVLADRAASVLLTALVHKAPLALLELLVRGGADPKVLNVDGFGALHALAEVNHPEPLLWLLSLGLDVEQRTHNGHTALQIAAALGHTRMLNALLEAGADPSARSGDARTAREIAVSEGKDDSVQALDAWQQRASARH